MILSVRRTALGVASLSVALATTLAAPPALAAAGTADEALAKLQAWLDGTRDLRGKFRQTLVSGALGGGLEEAGKFWLDRPGKMRWDYVEPERKVALLDGDRTLLWVPADRQVWEGSLSQSDAAIATLLAGKRRLTETFRASLAAGSNDEIVRLRLVPTSGSETFEEVTLDLGRSDSAIRAAEVTDAAGNRIRYAFAAVERNRGIPADRFHFEIPAGAEVMRSGPAGG
jgi:outer membrane lipoprotein carrier protein